LKRIKILTKEKKIKRIKTRIKWTMHYKLGLNDEIKNNNFFYKKPRKK
jgi:hypothetical protein